MKRILLLTAVLLAPIGAAFGQLSILLVDDSDDQFNHVEDFSAVLDSLGYTHTLFDAEGTHSWPSSATMATYDLVIWHCGADTDSLAFWSFTETTNPSVEAYLQDGGNLWLMGTDLLYDRYGVGPTTFTAGSMEYDYLGLESYDVQSYVDDGAVGLPQADPAAGQPFTGLPTLDWIFSTLWYVDGVTPVAGVTPVYEMGDANYTFAGKACGVFYNNGSNANLSLFFNPSQISTFQKHKDMTEAILNYYSVLAGLETPMAASTMIYPNPTNDHIRIQTAASEYSVEMINVFGQVLLEEKNIVEINVNDLDPGTYIVRITGDNFTKQEKIIVY